MDVACFLGLENAYAYADYEIQKLMSLDCFGKDTSMGIIVGEVIEALDDPTAGLEMVGGHHEALAAHDVVTQKRPPCPDVAKALGKAFLKRRFGISHKAADVGIATWVYENNYKTFGFSPDKMCDGLKEIATHARGRSEGPQSLPICLIEACKVLDEPIPTFTAYKTDIFLVSHDCNAVQAVHDNPRYRFLLDRAQDALQWRERFMTRVEWASKTLTVPLEDMKRSMRPQHAKLLTALILPGWLPEYTESRGEGASLYLSDLEDPDIRLAWAKLPAVVNGKQFRRDWERTESSSENFATVSEFYHQHSKDGEVGAGRDDDDARERKLTWGDYYTCRTERFEAELANFGMQWRLDQKAVKRDLKLVEDADVAAAVKFRRRYMRLIRDIETGSYIYNLETVEAEISRIDAEVPGWRKVSAEERSISEVCAPLCDWIESNTRYPRIYAGDADEIRNGNRLNHLRMARRRFLSNDHSETFFNEAIGIYLEKRLGKNWWEDRQAVSWYENIWKFADFKTEFGREPSEVIADELQLYRFGKYVKERGRQWADLLASNPDEEPKVVGMSAFKFNLVNRLLGPDWLDKKDYLSEFKDKARKYKAFIDKHKRKPSMYAQDKEEKSLGMWFNAVQHKARMWLERSISQESSDTNDTDTISQEEEKFQFMCSLLGDDWADRKRAKRQRKEEESAADDVF